ncbi:hypothetical protein KXV85_008569, partial [Aspergillus fumigatus]
MAEVSFYSTLARAARDKDTCDVTYLVNMGGVEAVGIVEGSEIRHVNAVFGDMIIGAGRAVDSLDAERGDKGFGGGEA